MQRSAMRELAFKLVYEIEVQKDTQEDCLDIFVENNEIEDENVIAYLKDIKEGIISNKDSKIPVYVLPTDEEVMIIRDTYSFIK